MFPAHVKHIVPALIGTILLIYGGAGTNANCIDQNALNPDSLCLLDLGTSDLLMTSLTPADLCFVLQNRESGPALWTMVLGPILVSITPQPWSVPSSSCLVVGTAGIISTIYGHPI